MIMSLLTLVIYVLILGLLYWLCDYLLKLFPLPDPLDRIVRAIVIVILVLILISILLSVLGAGYDVGLPRFR
jgi:ABC-type Na+ efflux pump permease subunit